jgi:hypothetical protein
VLLTAGSKNVLADSAASVGLLIAFYYGLTAFACVWFFRRSLLGSVRDLVTKGILPMIGGLTLLGAFVLSVKSYWPAASSYSSFGGIGGIFLIGAGSLVVGVIVMVVTARFLPRYFAKGITTPVRDEKGVPRCDLSASRARGTRYGGPRAGLCCPRGDDPPRPPGDDEPGAGRSRCSRPPAG